MSPAPQYHFLSWVRDGLASAIDRREDVSSPAGPASSQLGSTVTLNGDQVTPPQELSMIGPGDVTGFDRTQIVRRFPQPGTTDAEPTMFPLVEFDRPDLPWLATPRSTTEDRLRPWLCLVVVDVAKVGFESVAGVDMQVLTAPPAELPDPASLYLWAHAQVLLERSQSVAADLHRDERKNVSRLVCPRLLSAHTTYRACIVPTFLATARAILRDGPRTDTLDPAWTAGAAQARLPVFDSWSFSTGEAGGFEDLVDLLRGRPLPDGVGQRALDVSRDPGLTASDANAVTKVESALRAPGAGEIAPWDEPHFRAELAERVNAGGSPPEDEDEPVVAPPLYGGLPHHFTRVDPTATLWVDELNTDPRERVTAGLGTTVVQREQEALMERAWRQLAAHQQAELERQRALFARAVGGSLYRRHLAPMADERAFALTAPVHGRVPGAEAGTVTGAVERSRMPNAADGMAFRRALRRRGDIAARSRRLDGPTELLDAHLPTIAARGLAVQYAVPDGILGLLNDPREFFEPDVRDRMSQVFVKHGLERDDGLDLSALSSSIGANAQLAAMSAAELATFALPDDFGARLELAAVPELANARMRVEPGGLAEELVTQGFALTLDDGRVFAAPQDAEGRFIPVAITDTTIRVLTQDVAQAVAPQQIVFQEQVEPGALISVLLAPHTAVAIGGGETFAQAAVQIRPARRFAAQRVAAQQFGVEQGVDLVVEHPNQFGVAQGVDVVIEHPFQIAVDRQNLVPVAAAGAFHGIATHSIGEFALAPELVAQTRLVDREGMRAELMTWGQDQVVSLVSAQGTRLSSLSAIIDVSPGELARGLRERVTGVAVLHDVHAEERPAFAIGANVAAARAAVKPSFALERFLRERWGLDPSTVLEPTMWTPTYPDPMWRPLSGVSNDWILAGLDRIAPNTVTLAESNDRFIESYLVGLNHEIGREMVWREFPTDRRGTCFRSFWGVVQEQTRQPVAEIEELAAVSWQTGSLGHHKPQAAGQEGQLVLLIRGDLLRRFPGTIVFAVPANATGQPDFTSPKVKQAVFGGALGDEYRFLGFNLTAVQARTEHWWFAFAEQPTEPRFGLDTITGDWGETALGYQPPPLPNQPPEVLQAAAWNNAGWQHTVGFSQFRPGMHAPARADRLKQPAPALDPAVWGTHAADVARICFQQPVRASLPASEMLPPDGGVVPVEQLLDGLRHRHELIFRRLDG